ncbi:terminase small subunit [Bacillus cereus]|uniref:terminase small subunit n=1 Tax=Bacillus cereus TaxID=1396 RepID=UPI00192DE4AF|nr:terminase small subunit [Bacillus cereus]MDA2329860.1 terminase small subunit [Bacillus cereus]MDA2335666.1 terminase small subunit [Bacillus cereus]MDA2357749.1 terminase small subunit [Bacillus cereus]
MHELNERQKRFADYYIETGNASEAYMRAGYKSGNKKVITAGSSRLLANVNVSAYIDSHIAGVDSKRIADANEVLEFLTSVMRGEATGKTLRRAGMGAQVISDIEPSIGERKDAAVQLGKRYRLWTEKQEIEGVAQVIINGSIGNTCEECGKYYEECEC